jgi:hypothetical protein
VRLLLDTLYSHSLSLFLLEGLQSFLIPFDHPSRTSSIILFDFHIHSFFPFPHYHFSSKTFPKWDFLKLNSEHCSFSLESQPQQQPQPQHSTASPTTASEKFKTLVSVPWQALSALLTPLPLILRLQLSRLILRIAAGVP